MKSGRFRTVAKTASYTVNPSVDRDGTEFTNRGATGAVTFTLPVPNAGLIGAYYAFNGVADQTITVSAGASNGIAVNNAAAASLSASTAAQKIGARIVASCDGTSWLLRGAAVGVTYTVA